MSPTLADAGLTCQPDRRFRRKIQFDIAHRTGDVFVLLSHRHRATTYVVGPYVKKNTVVSTRYSQPSVLRTIEDILGTEHINLNTYYTRPMADVFDITSSGAWTFTAVARLRPARRRF